jgi:hypothetical protein
MNALAITGFEKQPRERYLFDRWVAQRRVLSPLGPFMVQSQMLGNGEMLGRASELVGYVESQGEHILDIVFGHYVLRNRCCNAKSNRNYPFRV